MTADLANPARANEIASDNPHAGCGPACVASIITDSGTPVSVTQVNDWIVANCGSTAQGTPLEWLSYALAHWGIASVLRMKSMTAVQANATAVRHETIVWHQCNSAAQPVPAGTTTISHYRVGYGDRNTMNPWGGVLSDDDCTIGDMGTHLEVLDVLPKDQGGASVNDLDNARAHVRNAYVGAFEREPESADVHDFWAHRAITSGSVDNTLAEIIDTAAPADMAVRTGNAAARQLAAAFPAFQQQLNAQLEALSTPQAVITTVDPTQLAQAVQAAVQAEMAKVIAALQGATQ